MAVDFELFHNPRCGKSREALKILQEKGVNPKIRLYLSSPPSKKELGDIIKKLGIKPAELIRFKETAADYLGLKPSDKRPDEEWIRLMVENPILIERPILVSSRKAVVGRPPESVLTIIQ